MKETSSPPPHVRAVLIPLDDRKALLALRDFERRVSGETDEPHGRDGQTPARRVA